MIELRQSPNYAKYLESLGWAVVKIGKNNCFVNKLIFTSIIKIQRPASIIEPKLLGQLVKKYNPFIVYIEPTTSVQEKYFIDNLGFKKTKNSLLPSKTIRINTMKSEKELLDRMHYKTRYNIKKSAKLGVLIDKSIKIDEFAKFWYKCALERGMFISLNKEIKSIYKAFGKDALILQAKSQGKIMGAVMVIFTKEVAYYMYAAATKAGKKSFAPTLLVWEILKEAKKRRLDFFDFEGIYDARFPIKSWKGFSRFKQSFGGDEILYPSPLKRIYFPWFLHI